MTTHEPYYERRTAEDGSYYFVLVAGNGEVQLTSETYETEEHREEAIVNVVNATGRANGNPIRST